MCDFGCLPFIFLTCILNCFYNIKSDTNGSSNKKKLRYFANLQVKLWHSQFIPLNKMNK